jgi:DNA segregation ATPase FtsK/SpoIIIE, S-DNA-T family
MDSPVSATVASLSPEEVVMDASREFCEVCGYDWEAPTIGEITARLVGVGEAWRARFAVEGDAAGIRPAPATWSPIEYGCHVRDVLLNLRERIVLGLAEDNPQPKPMFGDLRISLGLYATEAAAGVADDVDTAAQLLARTVAALDPALLERPIFYPWPRAATRTLRWVASQALHEAEHHLSDVSITT